MAAAVKQSVGVQPDLVVGNRGEFTVWVEGKQVAGKETADEDIVRAVHDATM